MSDKRSWLRLPPPPLPLVWIKAHQDHESSPLCFSNPGFTELDLNLRSDLDCSAAPGSDWVTCWSRSPVWSWTRCSWLFVFLKGEFCCQPCRRPGPVLRRWSSGWTARGGTGRWRSSTPWAPSWAGLHHVTWGGLRKHGTPLDPAPCYLSFH